MSGITQLPDQDVSDLEELVPFEHGPRRRVASALLRALVVEARSR